MSELEGYRLRLVKFLVVVAAVVTVSLHVVFRTIKCPCAADAFGQGQDQCLSFESETCLFDGRSSGNISNSKCKPRSCLFSPQQEFACGFPETGSYTAAPSAGPCKDPFMSMHRTNASACGARCCAADLKGAYISAGNLSTGAPRFTFQPVAPEGCRYAEVTRGQLTKTLEDLGAPLVVFGDSMLRQAYLRLVMMMRGQERLLDYTIHTHAQYLTCDEADAFRISADAFRVVREEGDIPAMYQSRRIQEAIEPFFNMEKGPGLTAARNSLNRCTRPPVQLSYVYAAEWEHQLISVPLYLDALPSSNVKPVIVLGVGYWEGDPQSPKAYMELLRSLRARASRVFIVGIATEYVLEVEGKDIKRKKAYLSRNDELRQFAHQEGWPFEYVDFDALATAPEPRPAGPLRADKHWMCRIGWNLETASKVKLDTTANGADADGNPLPEMVDAKTERLVTAADGLCADETNRNLWQMILNALVTPN